VRYYRLKEAVATSLSIKDLYEAVQEGRQAEQARTILKEIFQYEGII
jgi:hypothetical protein